MLAWTTTVHSVFSSGAKTTSRVRAWVCVLAFDVVARLCLQNPPTFNGYDGFEFVPSTVRSRRFRNTSRLVIKVKEKKYLVINFTVSYV